ncbi:uncharacterized protein LOC105433295 isoform X1 [Pogonomyrmex barbatus]|uniref:Uncharacterized protein LOC105433295 isoform X1 n=1 Tax=Pogonomyrmex barbatus TaxID=144034 RepID=A0A8N1SC56_9HYME|nr:uncharacterized protein LOC105433295 isoform X1 [Pogonomyrmex barbatus]
MAEIYATWRITRRNINTRSQIRFYIRSICPSVRPVVILRSEACLYKEQRLMYLMNECEKEISEAEREMASPQWDQFIQCLSKAGLVSARVIHFSVQIRIWTSNRLDHSYQFVLLHRPGVIPPLVLCNLSKKRRMLKTICFII